MFFKHKHITTPNVSPADVITAAVTKLANVLLKNVKAEAIGDTKFEDLKRLQQILAGSQICEPTNIIPAANNNQTDEPVPRVDPRDTPPTRVRDTAAPPRVPTISLNEAEYPTEHPTSSPVMNT